ncbi:MAG: hypothetical protein K6E33_01250 [Lachnospiraceae bacterium]|nr:hypothetical protein [Lachnospiraceae bacterium]
MSVRSFLSDVKYLIRKPVHVWKDRTEDRESLSLFSPLDSGLRFWSNGAGIIRHAGGETREHIRYTNSLEAFEYSASLGCRAIETDLDITDSGEIILIHSEGGKGPSGNTLMDLEMLLGFMDEHPDMYIVTDCKNGTFGQICETLGKLDRGYVSRFVIQLYRYGDFDIADRAGHFENYIFTLYDSGLYIWNSERIVKHCLRKGIGAVTMPAGFVRMNELELYRRYGIRVYIHSAAGNEVNEPKEVLKFIKKGVYGFYSDELTEKDLREIKENHI